MIEYVIAPYGMPNAYHTRLLAAMCVFVNHDKLTPFAGVCVSSDLKSQWFFVKQFASDSDTF